MSKTHIHKDGANYHRNKAIKNQNSEQSLKCNSSIGTFPWQQQDYMVMCYF